MGIKSRVADGWIFVQGSSREQYADLTRDGMFKWQKYTNKKTGETEKALIAPANLDALDLLRDTLSKYGLDLPPQTAEARRSLRAVQDAVDRERMNEKPVAFVKPPVKLPMYSHQVKAFNMCLLTFGWVQPGGEISV